MSDYIKAVYTPREEIANTVTHGIGAALSAVALIVLIVSSARSGDIWRVIAFSVYGGSLFALYTASTLYHAVTNEKLKKYFRMLDHCSIFLLIAGTYTPVLLLAMRGTTWGWTLFALIWTMAACGLVYELIFLGRYEWISLAIYGCTSWLAVVAIKPMMAMAPQGLMSWMIIGGLIYTCGIIFYICKRIPYHHAIWHLFVLGGSSLHFAGLMIYLAPVA